MKIGYVCTNYNNSHYTQEAVKSLLANPGHEYRVVVVDNCSRVEAKELLQILADKFPQVHIIFNEENVGYFKGLNIGIEYLRQQDPQIEWMVVGNNDLEFPADFGDRLAMHKDAWRSYPVISPDVITVDGLHQNPHVIASISRLRELFYDLYYANYYVGLCMQRLASYFRTAIARGDEEQWQKPQFIYQGHGSCYLLGPAFFDHFSAFWAPTFMMSEEYFLSKQLSDVGLRVYYDPAIKVVHHWHATMTQLPSKTRWQMARDAHKEYRKYVKVFPW